MYQMKKSVYSNEEKRTVVVVLRDEVLLKEFRGKSYCDPSDEFSEELGTDIANARAWAKFHNYKARLTKSLAKDLGEEAVKMLGYKVALEEQASIYEAKAKSILMECEGYTGQAYE